MTAGEVGIVLTTIAAYVIVIITPCDGGDKSGFDRDFKRERVKLLISGAAFCNYLVSKYHLAWEHVPPLLWLNVAVNPRTCDVVFTP